MQAVIMAGGKGTRLASVAKDIPKPMMPIDGKPLLEYQIENLKENGVSDIIIVIGHLGDIIKNHFGNGLKFGVNISYFAEETPLGTAGALAELNERLEDTFFLVFGDLFININFKRFFDFHKNTNADILLFTHPNSHPYDSDIVVTDSESRIIGWSRKNTERTADYKNLVNAGIYVVNREIVKNIPLHKKIDLDKDIIIPMISNGNVFAYQSTEYVKDMGTPERLEKVSADFHSGVCEHRNLKYKQKCIFLDRDGTINKYVGFLRSAEQVELEKNAAKAVRLINESEYLAVIITNQPVVARGECTFEELEQIHNRIYTLLGKEGAYVDGLYFCPHHPDNGFVGEIKELKFDCDCRKPNTGMLKKAETDFNADLSKSWFIGDTGIDVQTGINGGMNTVLLETGDFDKFTKYNVSPNYKATDLLDAVKFILKNNKK